MDHFEAAVRRIVIGKYHIHTPMRVESAIAEHFRCVERGFVFDGQRDVPDVACEWRLPFGSVLQREMFGTQDFLAAGFQKIVVSRLHARRVSLSL